MPEHLYFDEPSSVEQAECADCGSHYLLVKNFLVDEQGPYAVAMTACHHHDGVHEAWIDVALGTFDEAGYRGHVSFGCRVGPVEGTLEPAATAVDAAIPYSDSDFWGHKLSRSEALAHARIADFWKVVDFVLVNDPVVHQHIYRTRTARGERRSWRRRR